MPEAPTVKPVPPVEPANTVSLTELQNPVSVTEAEPVMEDFSAFVQARQPDLAMEQAAIDRDRENIRNTQDQLGTRAERGSELDNQFNLPSLYQEDADLAKQIALLTGSFDQAIANEEGAARPMEFITGRQAFLRRQKAAEIEALAAVQEALQGNIATAEGRVETALDREFGVLEDQLEADKFEYEENQKALEAKDKKAADQLALDIAERERVLEEQKAQKEEVLNLAIDAKKNGAPNDIVRQMVKKSDPAEALALAGNYIGKLDREAKQASNAATWALANERMRGGERFTTPDGVEVSVPTFEEWADENGGRAWHVGGTPEQMAELRSEYDDEISVMEQAAKVAALSPLAQEVVNNPQAYYDFTATQKGEIFEELSAVGLDTNNIISGKKTRLPATQVRDITQARSVKDDVEKLYDMLQNLPGNGPIGGRIQALDPYNDKIVAINAQITRIVPGLARGIFNEVGVLTDQDVERYRNTIANPNMTDTQIETLHNDTMAKIEQSLTQGIDDFARAGYNVDNFIEESTDDGLSDEEAYEVYEAYLRDAQSN